MMLREGATARSACQALEAANSRVQNAYSGGVGRGPNGMQLAYIGAIEDLESILTNTFTRLSAADLLHTPRHWYIVNATPAIEPMDARPANLAVSRAYQELTERFDRLIVEFTKLAKWLEKPGPIVFLDTNVLMHCMPLDTIDWAKVLEVGKAVVPRLAVPLAVVDELDRKKFEGGTMPRERAGRAIQLLHRLSQATGPDEATPITAAGNSRVMLEMPRDDVGRVRMHATDDELIAFAAFVHRAGGDRDVRFVTRDLGAQLRARREALPVVWLPDEYLKDKPKPPEAT